MSPEPVQRTKTYEESSAAAQKAIHAAGGVDGIVARVSGGFPCRADAGRLPGLQARLASARTELEGLDLSDRRGPRAGELRQTITSAVAEMQALASTIDTERRYAAQACVHQAAAGEPAALTELAQHAGRVSPDFLASIVEANR